MPQTKDIAVDRRVPITGSEEASPVRCIGIGASTGGPQLLQQIFAGLPSDYPIPIVVTQHLAKGFSGSLVKWLNKPGGISVGMAKQGEKLMPGVVYIAPDDRHMGVTSRQTIKLVENTSDARNCPSVAYMFDSLGKIYGKNCVAVLLSGMGSDGAAEMKTLRDLGALTIAQDKESSLIHGMAGEAINCGAAREILPPDRIIRRLLAVAQGSSRPSASP